MIFFPSFIDEMDCLICLPFLFLQFVNFTKIMSENTEASKKEAAFALAALMEIPFQYRAAQNIQLTE